MPPPPGTAGPPATGTANLTWNECVALQHTRWQRAHDKHAVAAEPAGSPRAPTPSAVKRLLQPRQRSPARSPRGPPPRSPRDGAVDNEAVGRMGALPGLTVNTIAPPAMRENYLYHDGIPGTAMTYFTA